jgi:transposase
MLQPTVRRSWAPRGQTPVHYSWDRRDRRSVVSALALSPRRRRIRLYFRIADHNIRAADFETFIADLFRHHPHGITLVLDRWQVHRSAARRLLERFPRRLHVEWLPPYAPDLNPVEAVWQHSKHADLANYLPADVDDLDWQIRVSLHGLRRKQPLLRSFFKRAGLKV